MTSDDDTLEGQPAVVGVPRASRPAGSPGGPAAPTEAAASLPVAPPARSAASPLPPEAARRRRLREGLRTALASYRLRIVGWYVLLLAVGTLATIFVGAQLLFQSVDARTRAELEQEVEEFRVVANVNDPATGEPFGSNVARMFDVFLESNIPSPNEIIVTFVEGQVYATSPDPRYELDQDPAFTAAVANTTQVATGRLGTPVGDVEYVAVPVRVDGQDLGVFTVAAFRDLARSEQEGIFIGALGVGLVVLLIGSLLAWRLADRLLEPVALTSATARAISETDLSQRVEVRGHDEVAYLARTLNDMLDRLEAAFEGQRRFLDDVGHELRTPLTIVRGHLELMDDGNEQERANTRELVLDELDRMARLVSDLITLAQAARPDFVRRAETDAVALARSIHEKATVLGEREWRLVVGGAGGVYCDPQRVTQAVLQLAANAVRHTAAGGRIDIAVDVTPAEARFWVADDGPGVPVEEQEAIFERFRRGLGQPRAVGGGLGLSIVRAIAEAHDGRAFVESQPGGGARFTIAIPHTALPGGAGA